ncbi:MAG TPA: phosphoribosylanthranilate isomerase [Anaerolineales bacterium]
MQVKICGITRLDDALAAVDAGADLLGFNFYPPSPRYLEPGLCAQIVAKLPKRVLSVGVFVNPRLKTVRAILSECGLDLAQLCGDEPPELLAALGEQAFKVLHPANSQELDTALENYPARSGSPAWLVDAYRPGEFGGTGRKADWGLAFNLARRAPILLAGGLTPENVASAVEQVQPWGVDVASGVESSPSRKDPARMQAFVAAARSVVSS